MQNPPKKHNRTENRIRFTVKKTLKVAFLYIGTLIGAGFSSGREIALFFRDLAPYNAALSAIVMSLFALLFLTAGRLDLIPKGKIVSFAIFVSGAISLTSMLAGGEYVLKEMTGVPLLCLIFALLGAIVVSLGIEKIKIANLILVPLIALSIIIIFFKIPHSQGSAPFSILMPIAYGGLDVLLGGIVVSDEGKNMTFKQTIASASIVCIFLFFMLYMLQTIVLNDTNDSLMPVFAVSKNLRLQAISGVLIASAIFTTLVSSLKITSDKLIDFCVSRRRLRFLSTQENKPIVIMFSLVAFYPLSFFGFGKIVDTLYPITSGMGILLALIVLVRLVIYLAKNRRHKKGSAKPRSRKAQNNAVNPRRRCHPPLSED